MLGYTESRNLYLLVNGKSTREYLPSSGLPRHSTWEDKMCPGGLGVELSGEGLPSMRGPGFSPSTEKEERYPRKSETAHQLSIHQESIPSDSLSPAWKRLSNGQVEAEVWKEQHPAEKGRQVIRPLQDHGCRSVSSPSHRCKCFSL